MDKKRNRRKGEAKNIRIYEDTKKSFEKIGRYGESADDILRRLIATYYEKNGDQ
jgi:hypothetical protein